LITNPQGKVQVKQSLTTRKGSKQAIDSSQGVSRLFSLKEARERINVIDMSFSRFSQ
jgi:hypothetical protein